MLELECHPLTNLPIFQDHEDADRGGESDPEVL